MSKKILPFHNFLLTLHTQNAYRDITTGLILEKQIRYKQP